ncbi:uncharacterized protein B0T23DRAFT_173403 [Neurospora hispaniola]|uniref:Secreted protein n=1 Tax=Neurospora hispaniola TaxID=588809 RepID=A0AAJ0MQJ8_9PEZI|nr:hypothetical protein B0T23DRAFT_173403 [Neurospora hispaniola]
MSPLRSRHSLRLFAFVLVYLIHNSLLSINEALSWSSSRASLHTTEVRSELTICPAMGPGPACLLSGTVFGVRLGGFSVRSRSACSTKSGHLAPQGPVPRPSTGAVEMQGTPRECSVLPARDTALRYYGSVVIEGAVHQPVPGIASFFIACM